MPTTTRLLLVEPDLDRADAMIDRLHTWFPSVSVDLARNAHEERDWRERYHGVTCDHDGAITLIDLAMELEEKGRDTIMAIAALRGSVDKLNREYDEMSKKIDGLVSDIEGDEVRPGLKSVVVALHGDHNDKLAKPGMIATQAMMAVNVQRIMGWGSAISMLIIGGLIAIWVSQTFWIRVSGADADAPVMVGGP